MTYLHVGIKFAGTDTHECNTVSVSLVHIGLNLEYKGTELMLRGIDQTNVCLSGQRSGGHLQKMFQEDLHTEIRQCGTKAYRSQITFLYLIQVKLRAGTVQQFHLSQQLVRRIFSDANILLACGASPIMSDEPEDVEDITSICGGLNINIGTLHKTSIDGMYRAGAKSAELGHKILLDPVGAGASHLRTETAVGLMAKIPFTVIRGNISEIKTLALGSGTTKGVDADVADKVTDENLDSAVAFAKNFAKDHNCVVAITGAIDLVADGDTCYVIRNGRPEMGSITGTGCQLSGMMTAYLVANPDEPLQAAAAAVCAMGLAGEIGWSHMKPEDGNSTYRNRIIDAIYHMDGETLEKGAKYEVR